MNAIAIGGAAAAGLLLMCGGGWAMLRTRRVMQIADPEVVADAAQRALPAFAVAGAVIGADGYGALAVASDGRVAAVKQIGGRLIVREIPWHSVRATSGGIVIETGDRTLGEVTLAAVDVLDIRRLAPKGVRV